MIDSVCASIIADDIFEKVLTDKKFGINFLKRISADEFGSSVYVTNMTVISVLQKFNYDDKIKQMVKGLLYHLPQYDYKDDNKSSLIIEEPVRGQIWGEAIDWFVRYSMPESEKKIDLTLVNWSDIGVLKFILKIFKNESKISYVITQNQNYAKVAELSRENREFPKFQVTS